jgi:two-component system NtrC family sensor kinase
MQSMKTRRSRLQLRAHKRIQNQLALKLISEAITSNFGSPEIQEWLVASICQMLRCSGCVLLFLNQDREEAITYDTSSHQTRHAYEVSLNWDDGLLEQCICQRKPIFLPPGKPDVHSFPWVSGEKLHLLCVPLITTPPAGEKIQGALAVYHRGGEIFSAHDQELLNRVAAAAAQSIHNARLIQDLKIANADLEVSHWQLLRSRNTLRALFDSIPTSIYIIDTKFNLAAINLHRAGRINTAPNQLVGRRCYEALYQRSDICQDCQVIETLFQGSHTTRTRRLWEADQEPQEWEISTYPIQDDNNQLIQAIVLEQDVTEKRRLETTLAQSEKLAAVGQLAAGLAHEINNPLTAIIANAQLLQREIPAEDDKQELVDLIARAGNRASQVVRNLLDLARKEQYDFAQVDVNDNIKKSLTLLQHEFVTRQVKLIFDPSENLPRIKASQDHLQGVWLNLLTNAMDALENEPGEIRINTRQQGNELRVVVADTGKGIPPEKILRVFEPFYTTKAPGRGTGLGLSVCHRVIKQHGGRILVDSKIDVGTQFTVVLPIS